MIGGFELELNARITTDDIDRLLRLVRTEWPHCVVETSDGSLTITAEQALRDRSTTNEFFLYKDLAAKQSWDAHGLADENHDAMLSVLYDEDSLLLVADDEHSFSGALASELLDAVQGLHNRNRLVHVIERTAHTQQASAHET